MYCKNCGKEIDDKAAVCVYCGVPTKEAAGEKNKVNGLGVAGFILSLLSLWLGMYYCIASILGLILSAVGMGKSKECSKCNGLAVAGLILSILSLLIWLLVWLFVGSVILGAASYL